MSQEYTRQEVAAHRSRGDIYIVLKTKVYDVTGFIKMHP
jgi:cytochrome b involved in lipid metabolism